MTEQPLQDLHSALIDELLKRVKSGTAAAADLAVARAMLRDNNISALPRSNPKMMELATSLPYEGDEDDARG